MQKVGYNLLQLRPSLCKVAVLLCRSIGEVAERLKATVC